MKLTKTLPTDRPPHPGYVLKTDYIDPLRYSLTDVAAKLGISRNTISSIINGRAGISADMALRFSRAFKTTPEYWLKLASTYQLWEATQFDSGWKEVLPLKANQEPTPAPPTRNHYTKKRVPKR
jgi:addiction module HigA family antidote